MSADQLQGDYIKYNKYTWLETRREILDEVSKMAVLFMPL